MIYDERTVHVLPTSEIGLHTETGPCWCGAVAYVLCGECGGTESGCWQCRGQATTPGFVRAQPGDRVQMSVHEATPLRGD